MRANAEEFVLADGRRLVLLADGRLVNLGAAEGHPAAVMDMSFADQALAVEWLATHHEELQPRVYDVPKELDDRGRAAEARLDGPGDRHAHDRSRRHYLSSYDLGT